MSLLGRIFNMISRGVVTKVDDTRKLQELQIELFADEAQDRVERFENYGFTSVPKAGAEVVALFPAGVRSHGLVIVVADRRYRLKPLESGEVAMHDDQGQKIHLMRAGILIESPFEVKISAPTTIVESDDVTVTATTATITADTLNLGGTGGNAVARVGDHVVGGVITEGSSKVKAV